MNMSQKHREWTARFSAYLADELDVVERSEVEAHLAACRGCARGLEELTDVVTRARALPDLHPPRDLWPGISAAISRTSVAPDDSAVIELPTARVLARRGGAVRVEVSRWRLVAAAVVLVVVSVTVTWWAGRAPVSVAGEGGGTSGALVTGATDALVLPRGLAEELATLEEILESARATLDPNTVRVLQRNLSVIEQAIADSREALAQDPGNAFLREHLERMYRRKLVYLQDAVRVAEWAG